MIRFILLQNRAGKTRLAKYYVPIPDSEKRKLEYEIHRLVVNRDPKHTNLVEVRVAKHDGKPSSIWVSSTCGSSAMAIFKCHGKPG
jgi:AP-2 complex subunit sigma-1